MAMARFNSNNFSMFSFKYLQKSQQFWKIIILYFHMDGGEHFLQPSTTHDVFSVKSSYLQMIDPIPDILATPLLYVPVHILTGSVQTDKQHAHKLYSSTNLLTH